MGFYLSLESIFLLNLLEIIIKSIFNINLVIIFLKHLKFIKDCGIIIDTKLSFKSHVENGNIYCGMATYGRWTRTNYKKGLGIEAY